MGNKQNKCEMPKHIKFTYFDVRARGEGIRLNLAYAGLPFEDVRLKTPNFPDSSWWELKPNTPWNQVPLLEVDGHVIGQSLAIARYVAKITGIAGKTLFEQARYDAIVDACKDLFELWAQWYFEKDETIKEQKLAKCKERLTSLVEQLEKFLGKDKFFGGEKLSWADLHFFNLFEVYKYHENGFEDIFKASKPLAVLIKRVEEIPRIKEYLKKRKFTAL